MTRFLGTSAASDERPPASHGPHRQATGRVVVVRAMGAATLAMTAICSLPVAAQSAAPSAAEAPLGGVSFTIRGFDIEGESPLDEQATTEVLAPFLRQQATFETLGEAAAALEALLRERGYGFYRVTLPPQTLGEVVKLRLLRFVMHDILVEGHDRLDREEVLRSVPELSPGASPNLQRMAVQTRLANMSGHKQLAVGLRESERPDALDATVRVQESKPWGVGVDLSNEGTATSGRDRFTTLAYHNNLWQRDHQLAAAWTTSLQRPGDVRQLGLSYQAPIYTALSQVYVSAYSANTVGRFGAFSSEGAGHGLELGWTRHLFGEGGYQPRWTVALQDRLFKGAALRDASGAVLPGTAGPDMRSRALALVWSARHLGDGFNADYRVSWHHALGGGRGNSLAAYSNGFTNPAITTANWQALRAQVGAQWLLPSQWVLGLRAQAQWSPDALIAGEQFGLGGPNSVRGADNRSLSGDRGLQVNLEAYTPDLAPGLKALAFADFGWLANRNPNAARLASDRLGSVGLGLRWVLPQAGLNLQLQVGRIVTGSRQSLLVAPEAPQHGDSRWHLMLNWRY